MLIRQGTSQSFIGAPIHIEAKPTESRAKIGNISSN